MKQYKLTIKDVNSCQFHEWYKDFAHVTFKSRIIPLPEHFMEYLNEESVFMPTSMKREDETHYSPHDFSSFEAEVQKALDDFDGKVFVKLNWKAPKDAIWVVPELKCESVTQIYQVLKCSDLVRLNFDSWYLPMAY